MPGFFLCIRQTVIDIILYNKYPRQNQLPGVFYIYSFLLFKYSFDCRVGVVLQRKAETGKLLLVYAQLFGAVFTCQVLIGVF